MLSPALISELQQILISDFGINADLKETANIGNSLTKYFEILININKNEKSQVPTKKRNY
jgi:hypothetical protein